MGDSVRPGDYCLITRDVMVGDYAAFRKGETVRVDRVEPDPQMPDHKYVVYSTAMSRHFRISDNDLVVTKPRQSPQAPTYASAPYGPARKTSGGGSGWKIALGIAAGVVVIAVVVVVLVLVLGGGNGSGPASALETYIRAVETGDTQTAYDMLTEDAREEMYIDSPYDLTGGVAADIPGFKILDSGEQGNTGWVDYQLSSGYASVSTRAICVKEGNEWKIDSLYSSEIQQSAGSNAAKRTCQANQRTVDGAVQSYQANDPDQRYPDSLEVMTMPDVKVLKSIPTCPVCGDYIWITAPGNTGSPPYISCPVHPAMD